MKSQHMQYTSCFYHFRLILDLTKRTLAVPRLASPGAPGATGPEAGPAPCRQSSAWHGLPHVACGARQAGSDESNEYAKNTGCIAFDIILLVFP